jgi:hypothetical protein
MFEYKNDIYHISIFWKLNMYRSSLKYPPYVYFNTLIFDKLKIK